MMHEVLYIVQLPNEEGDMHIMLHWEGVVSQGEQHTYRDFELKLIQCRHARARVDMHFSTCTCICMNSPNYL